MSTCKLEYDMINIIVLQIDLFIIIILFINVIQVEWYNFKIYIREFQLMIDWLIWLCWYYISIGIGISIIVSISIGISIGISISISISIIVNMIIDISRFI